MADVGLTHVALPVTDLERSIVFYSTYANLRVVHRRPEVAWLSDRRHPFVIVLVEASRVEDPLRPVGHLGIGCESREAVDGLCEKARGEGILIGGPNDYGPPVGYWAFLRDPDGHTVEVSFGQDISAVIHSIE